MSAVGTDREGPEGIGIMELAYGFVAQTLQTHDELVAGRLNERRRAAADRRADEGERAEQGHGRGHGNGFGQRFGHAFAEWRHGRAHDHIQGLPVAH